MTQKILHKEVSKETNDHDSEIIISTFLLDNMEFGINVQDIREALFFRGNILNIPTSIDIIDGVINLRDSIIPIIDMRKRFGLAQKAAEALQCIAIAKFKNRYFGLKFDNISQVIRSKQEDISKFTKNSDDMYFSNNGALLLENGTKLVQLLDLELLFKDFNLPLIENNSLNARRKFLEIKQDITFSLNTQEYALGMTDIQEIIKIPEIKSKVEHLPYIKGVISLRDQLITIVDLQEYLFNESTKITNDSRIIILQNEPVCGIIVDSINEVINYEVDKLLEINDFDKNFLGENFSNIISLNSERNIIKVDPIKLFDEDAKEQIIAGANVNKKYSKKKSTSKQTNNKEIIEYNDFIIFKIGELFAIDITLFQEIIKYTDDTTSIPNSKDFVQGMLNLRGEPIPIINLRKYYSLEDYKDINQAKILILNSEHSKIGVIVDEVVEILKTSRVEITNYPKSLALDMAETMKSHINNILMIKRNDIKTKSLTTEAFMLLDINELFNALAGEKRD